MKPIFIFFTTALLLSLVGCSETSVEGENGLRPIKPESSSKANIVYSYLPAPGQFINDGYTLNNMTEAIDFATKRLVNEQLISLGAFGGELIVGFDHSIINHLNEYDFGVAGNSFENSSEPAFVYVMQDTNGNALPDDKWYRLKGSEDGIDKTTENYSVTYFRPTMPNQPVKWEDSKGNKGEVNYVKYNNQPYYYPLWVKDNQYTLTGVLLEPNARFNENTGEWEVFAYEWGYADNFSQVDRLHNDRYNYFKIENAMDTNGELVSIDYIDFIKIQSAVLANVGILGEISTEVAIVVDYSMQKK